MTDASAPTGPDQARLDQLAYLVERAKAYGADAVDAIAADSAKLSIDRRLDRPEMLERAESTDIGVRVFIGSRVATVSGDDSRRETLDQLAERAVTMARAVPEDPFLRLATPEELVAPETVDAMLKDLDLHDDGEPSVEVLTERARACEAAALAVDGVTNSEGANATYMSRTAHLVASNGFSGHYRFSRNSVSTSVVAGSGTGMHSDYDYSTKTHAEDLEDPATIGRSAGERAVAMLNARKMPSKRVPVVFDQRISYSLVNLLLSAITGEAIARGTSFLKDRMGDQVFAPGITVTDDPAIRRGIRSRPFDAEGLLATRRSIIDDGRLTSWILDLRSAAKLGLKSTGHASRDTAGPRGPSPCNVRLEPGALTRDQLIGEIEEGFYVTSMLGSAVSIITGDYSRGAVGFWIENGEITFPVTEMTIAGDMRDMFRTLTPADDLKVRIGIDAPTLRVEGMTIAGQ